MFAQTSMDLCSFLHFSILNNANYGVQGQYKRGPVAACRYQSI